MREKLAAYLRLRFEVSHGAGRDNLSMEGVRGIAVALVFLVHFDSLIAPWLQAHPIGVFSSAIGTLGNLGVDIFFVLSGYLIYRSLIDKDQNYFGFLTRRIIRIYPTFLVVLALYLVLSFKFPGQSKLPTNPSDAAVHIAQNILLLPGIFPIPAIVTVAWSLSYEMFYYVTLPVLMRLANFGQRTARQRLLALVLTFALLAVGLVLLEGPFRLAMFIVGMLIFEVKQAGFTIKPHRSLCVAALIAAAVSPQLLLDGSLRQCAGLMLQSAALFVLGYASIHQSWPALTRVLNITPLRWLGNMSYSYYLIHGVALKAAFMAVAFVLASSDTNIALMYWVLLLFTFGWTLAVAAGLFLAIERPWSLAPKKVTSALTVKSL